MFYIGFIKLTNLGKTLLPHQLTKLTDHVAIIYPDKLVNFAYTLTSKPTTFILNKMYINKYVHIPDISGQNRSKYLVVKPFKFNNKIVEIYKDTQAEQYLVEHMDKFKQVLAELPHHPYFLSQTAIDLTKYMEIIQ